MPPENTLPPISPAEPPEPIGNLQQAAPPSESPAPAPQNDPIKSPAGDIQIDNVNQSLWQYIKRRKLGELLLFAPLVIVWEAFTVILLVKSLSAFAGSSSQGPGKFFAYMMILPVVIFSAWIGRLRKQFEEAFLEEFARANGYTFEKDGTVSETYGTIFRINGTQQVSDVVTGSYGDSGLRLFLYELTIGSGRSQQTYQDTVIELDLHGQLPDLLMANKKSRHSQLNIAGSFGIKNTIKLEGDFNQYFTLYAPQGNEVEALEVFSPDTMALMEDASKQYTVEFAGNRIYIYSNGFISTTEQLTQVFTLAKKLIDKIAPLAMRLQQDSALAATPVNIIKARKRSVISGRISTAIGIASVLIGITVTIILIFTVKPSQQQTGRGSPAFTSAISQAENLDSQSVSPTNNYGSRIINAGRQALSAARTNRQKEQADYWIGVGYFWEGQNAIAANYELQAIQYYGSDPYAYITEGNAEVDTDNYVQALMAVKQAISLDPSLPSAYRLEAAVLANLGQKSAAIGAAQQALAIDKSLDSGTVSYQQYISEDQQMITYVSTAVPPVYVQP